MQVLEVDGGTLGAMSEHLEALDRAEEAALELHEQMGVCMKAWAAVGESAANVKSQLAASGHKQLEEAHANAAGGGAKKEFYGEDGGGDTLGRTPDGAAFGRS
jgi:hypothetical protein